jgi:hypothetical protein
VVWWIEHLVDGDGKPVADGHCGAKNEITRVTEPTTPNTPGFEFFSPFMPDAGFITRQIAKIVLLGSVVCLGAWQLTSKNSWLFKHRK